MITDDKRLELASHKRFNLTYNFDRFTKTKKDEWFKKQEEWHNKLQRDHHIECRLCKTHTTNFNFIEIDDSFTTPNKLWCKECELWWNQRNGFELTLEITSVTVLHHCCLKVIVASVLIVCFGNLLFFPK